MNRISVLSMAGMLALSFAAYAGDDDPKTFRGEISDSQCAFNVHSLTQSHQEMVKSKSGEAGKTAASCSQFWIGHMGGKFVLASKGARLSSRQSGSASQIHRRKGEGRRYPGCQDRNHSRTGHRGRLAGAIGPPALRFFVAAYLSAAAFQSSTVQLRSLFRGPHRPTRLDLPPRPATSIEKHREIIESRRITSSALIALLETTARTSCCFPTTNRGSCGSCSA